MSTKRYFQLGADGEYVEVPPPTPHEHTWAVRTRREPYTSGHGHYSGYTFYFCTNCLEEKTVSDK